MSFVSGSSTMRPGGLQKVRWWVCIVFAHVCFQPLIMCRDSLASDWVGRTSVNREADTVDQLAQLGNFEQALKWCDQNIDSSPPRSVSHAWWVCKRADVGAVQAKQSGALTENSLRSLVEPLERLLRQYPAHAGRLFLKAKVEEITLQSITSRVVQAAIETTSEDQVDSLLRSLIAFDNQVSELMDDLSSDPAFQSLRASGRNDSLGGSNDLQILTASLSTLRLQAAILRTELFDPGSRDFVSASAKANSLADDVRILLPVDSPARLEVDLLHCQSLLRGGRLDEATQRLQQVGQRIRDRGDSGSEVNRWLALVVELHLLQSNLSAAKRRLDAFFGGQPERAIVSLPLDLARLKWLVEVAKGVPDEERDTKVAEASAWIESIERRHDRYARRRAEALLLSQFGATRTTGNSNSPNRNPSASSATNVNASLMAIQGRKQLRDGNTIEAARMLAAAALAESSPKGAVDFALQSAAAWEDAGRPLEAASLLTTVSTKHNQESRSGSLHLQAAVLATKSEQPWTADELLSHLQVTAKTWAKDERLVGMAKTWAVQTLSRLGREEEAAKVVGWTEAKDWSPRDTRTSIDLWLSLLRTSEDSGLARRFSQWLVQSATKKGIPSNVESELARAAVLGLAPSDLRQLSPRLTQVWSVAPVDSEAVFLQGLSQFRMGSSDPLTESPSEQTKPVATWRLMQDGRDDARVRSRVDALLESWSDVNQMDLDTAERMVWMGEWKEARLAFQNLIQASDQKGKLLRTIANRLQAINEPDALKLCVEYWDKFAAGIQQGSHEWHLAKLAAAESLHQLGQQEEATKRLRYVWLTNPPDDVDLRDRYEKLLSLR